TALDHNAVTITRQPVTGRAERVVAVPPCRKELSCDSWPRPGELAHGFGRATGDGARRHGNAKFRTGASRRDRSAVRGRRITPGQQQKRRTERSGRPDHPVSSTRVIATAPCFSSNAVTSRGS